MTYESTEKPPIITRIDACLHQGTVEEALASPPLAPRAGDTWLFKASRGMALERLLVATRARIGGGALDPTLDRALRAPAERRPVA